MLTDTITVTNKRIFIKPDSCVNSLRRVKWQVFLRSSWRPNIIFFPENVFCTPSVAFDNVHHSRGRLKTIFVFYTRYIGRWALQTSNSQHQVWFEPKTIMWLSSYLNTLPTDLSREFVEVLDEPDRSASVWHCSFLCKSWTHSPGLDIVTYIGYN